MSQITKNIIIKLILILNIVFLIIVSPLTASAEENLISARVYFDPEIIEFESMSTSQAYELPLREIFKSFDVEVSDGQPFFYESSVEVPMENRYGDTSIGGSGSLTLEGVLKYTNRGTPFISGDLTYIANVEDIDSSSEEVASTIFDVECEGEFKIAISRVSGEATFSYGGMFEDSDTNLVTKTINYKDGSQLIEDSEYHHWFGVTYNLASEVEFDNNQAVAPVESSNEDTTNPTDQIEGEETQDNEIELNEENKSSALISTIIISIISSVLGVGAVASISAGILGDSSSVNDNISEDLQPEVETIQHPDGVEELIYPNGSRQIKFPDGSTKEKWPDGTITGTTADGTQFEQKVNGELIMDFPDGERIIEYPDGRVKTIRDNGLEITDEPDGTTVVLDPSSGDKVIHVNDGNRIFVDEEGKAITVDENGNIIRVEKDGVIGERQEDGTVEITYPNSEGKIKIDENKNIEGKVVLENETEYIFDGDESGVNITTNNGIEMNADENGVITGDLGNGTTFVKEIGSSETRIEMEDGSSLVLDSDGTISGKDGQTGYNFEIDDNGSLEMKDENGNYTKVNEDGSFIIKTEDGFEGTQNSVGEQHLKAPNGNNMTKSKDGTVIVNFEDGSIGKIYPDKTVEIKHPDGTVEKSINDNVTIEKPDGSVEELSMDQYNDKYGQ